MGKAGGAKSNLATSAGASHRQMEMKGALGKHLGRYLDQYTFICVFGSVVGYVVLPLIGTMETLIFSVLVIGFSINTIMRKSPSKDKDERRRSLREDRKSKKSDLKKASSVQVITDSENQRKQQRKIEDSRKLLKDAKIREDIEAEKEQKLEERREKKARKKEVRLKRKEDENKERERELAISRERQEKRALRKQHEKEAKGKTKGFCLPTFESIKAIVSNNKTTRRERKYSTSSSTSSGTSSTCGHVYPSRMPDGLHSQSQSPITDTPSRSVTDTPSRHGLLSAPGNSAVQPVFPVNQSFAPFTRNATSTNVSFPHLVTPSNKSTPWSTLNNSSPHQTLLPVSPTHTSPSNTDSSQRGFKQLEPSSTPLYLQQQPCLKQPSPVDTLTPVHDWLPSYNHGNHQSESFTSHVTSLPVLNKSSCANHYIPAGMGSHGNMGDVMEYGYFPNVAAAGNEFQSNCYSLFSDHGLSPFMNLAEYTSTLPRDGCGLQSPDYSSSVVDVSNDVSVFNASPETRTTEGYDDWPIL